MADPIAKENQTRCKFCNSLQIETQGNNDSPRCPKQGCPGQHTK